MKVTIQAQGVRITRSCKRIWGHCVKHLAKMIGEAVEGFDTANAASIDSLRAYLLIELEKHFQEEERAEQARSPATN